MDNLAQKEIAAIWLYHGEYANSPFSATGFYEHLDRYQKNLVDEMISEIQKAGSAPAPAVDWRQVAEQLYIALQFSAPHPATSSPIVPALDAYERALRAENPALTAEAG